MLTINEEDPCGAAATLRQIYNALIAGERAETVTFKAGATGVERSVTYHRADPGRLLTVIRTYEQRCAKLSGSVSRYAIRGGGI
jgi:hypothetical protein